MTVAVRCPICAFDGEPRSLHAHLADAHAEQVTFEARAGRTFYQVVCPVCSADYSHEIKPRGRDPDFVAEFQAQIRLVAFDMLLNHLLAEHLVAAEEGEDDPGGAPAPLPPADGGAVPAWLAEARRRASDDRP